MFWGITGTSWQHERLLIFLAILLVHLLELEDETDCTVTERLGRWAIIL